MCEQKFMLSVYSLLEEYMSVGFGSLEISAKMFSFFCYIVLYHVSSFLARSYVCKTKFILRNDLFH